MRQDEGSELYTMHRYVSTTDMNHQKFGQRFLVPKLNKRHGSAGYASPNLDGAHDSMICTINTTRTTTTTVVVPHS